MLWYGTIYYQKSFGGIDLALSGRYCDTERNHLKSFFEHCLLRFAVLDIYVRNPGGGAVIGWALTGCVSVVPNGHAFPEIVVHGETGFLCDDVLDYKEVCQRLGRDRPIFNRRGEEGAKWARTMFCNHQVQKIWRSILDSNY